MQGVTVVGGVIDSDYRGPIKIFLANLSENIVTIPAEKAVAQLVIVPFYNCYITQVESPEMLEATMRGAGGFGSTDRQHSLTM
eukprot:gnl/Chilomastix_caulleri/6579.p1 GENE.gnl/Chilomastix_caulleri/6579~~gnl/Chilomastix_caulleri/6579.p1  ORF type:complete len:83 (+),score=14.76 gnl/Chilomastix_caulleri/6579:19-267(+)